MRTSSSSKPPTAEVEGFLSLARSLSLSFSFLPLILNVVPVLTWTSPHSEAVTGPRHPWASLKLRVSGARLSVFLTSMNVSCGGCSWANICALVSGTWGRKGELLLCALSFGSRQGLNSCCDLKVINRCDEQILPLHQKWNWDEKNNGWIEEIFFFVISFQVQISCFQCMACSSAIMTVTSCNIINNEMSSSFQAVQSLASLLGKQCTLLVHTEHFSVWL